LGAAVAWWEVVWWEAGLPLRREGDNGGLAAEDASGVLCGERGAVGGSVEEVVDIALSFMEGADILLRVRRRDGD